MTETMTFTTAAVSFVGAGPGAARFLQGRLMMHRAAGDTPVTLIENVSRPDRRIVAASLATLPQAAAALDGPVVVLYGIAPSRARAALPLLKIGPQLKEITA